VHLQVQLHRRARRLGRDRVEVGEQVIGGDGVAAGRVVARDVEADGLAAQAHQLLVQHGVAVFAGQRVDDEVPLLDRRQDPDHGQPRPARGGRRAARPSWSVSWCSNRRH
jgi:hypothetical protein